MLLKSGGWQATCPFPSALSDIFHLDQVFGNLYGIECCPLLDLVANDPESESVLVGQVLSDASHTESASGLPYP